ncbi:hypothetical protein D3C76_1375000 [compost metagenome]
MTGVAFVCRKNITDKVAMNLIKLGALCHNESFVCRLSKRSFVLIISSANTPRAWIKNIHIKVVA